MKTKELVQYLIKIDPDGESEVVISNSAIYAIVKSPSFEDGCLEKLHYDRLLNIESAEITTERDKIGLTNLPISCALIMNPDLEVKLDIHNNFLLRYYTDKVADWRRRGDDLHGLFAQAG